MAFQDAFRFSLKSNPTTWLYWNNGSLGTSTTPRYIKAPDKWQETIIDWKRSFDKHGLIRSNAAPYQFVGDGASVLRSLYYGGSCEAKVYLLIERMRADTTGYDDYFGGEIDLSTFDNGVLYNGGSRGVSAAVIPGGIDALLTANENIPYEIELDPAGSDIIHFDGIKLKTQLTYYPLGLSFTTAGLPNIFTVAPSVFGLQEGDYPVGIPQGETINFFDDLGPSVSTPPYDDYLFEATINMTCSFRVDMRVNMGNPSGNINPAQFKCQLVKVDSAQTIVGFPINVYTHATTCPVNSSQLNIPVINSVGFTMNAGDRIYFMMGNVTMEAVDIDVIPNPSNTVDYSMVLSCEYRTLSSNVPSKPYWKVVSELLEKITGISGVLQSNLLTYATGSYYDCYPANLRVTCGDALRNLAGNAVQALDQSPVYPKIRVTWADVWKDLKNRLGLGMSVRGNKVIIERADGFFNKNTVIANLGEVKTFNDTVSKEYFSTSQNWGYANQTYDKLNGRDEPNTTEVWKMPTTRIAKEEDNLCPFRSDMYGIEYTRANLIGKKTTDSKSDNETFVIETEATPVPILLLIGGMYVPVGYAYNLYRPQNSYTQPADTGLLFPTTAYNLTQTGKRNLLRSGPMVRLSLKGLDNEYITYQTSDKNSELSINCGVGVITEKDPIKVSDLPAAIGQPSLLHIEHVTSLAIKAALDNNPDGCFTFTENGKTYKGFPMEIGVKAGVVDTYQTTLLATPDCDLLQKVE